MLNPIRFDNNEIIFPLSWDVNPVKSKDTYETEAGTEIDVVRRTGRLSITASFKCTSAWLQFFARFREMDSFTLTLYDPLTETDDEHTVRMDNFSYSLVHKSQDLTVTNGVWEVIFDLEEF